MGNYARYGGLGGGGGGGGSGTVTSVALHDGSTTPIYSVSGSPVTTSGTLTFSLATQTANKLFAGPTTGSAAQPGFRSLVTADLPFAITNLTDAGTDGIVITNGTGAVIGASPVTIAQHVADSTHNGYLSSTDWSTFNGKQGALTIGNLTDSGTDGIVVTGGTGAVIGSGTSIAQHVADATHNGYLLSTDWSTFNGKQSAGNYITALTGDVTASGPGSAAATLAATSNATLVTLSALTTASALATVGTITVGTWSGTTIAINKGGTGVTSVTTAPAATSFAGWDANKNLSANNLIEGYSTTATAAGTTTLTVASTYLQYFTGSTTQTVVLPVASTLVLGQQFQIVNNSSGLVTINSSGSNLVQTLQANSSATVTCILTSGTTAASWSVVYNSIPTGSAVAPTVQTFTSGSGTYTAPTNPAPLFIVIELVGGGGGGGGSGSTSGAAATDGTDSTFSVHSGAAILTAGKGLKGARSADGGAGGTATVAAGATKVVAVSGGSGGSQSTQGGTTTAASPFLGGGQGGSSAFGGAGFGGSAGSTGAGGNAATNSGGGGGGAYASSSTNSNAGGSGGGSGAYIKAIIASPSASYDYSVGAKGTGQALGSGGAAGGDGGSGYIVVTEYYAGNSSGGTPVANQTANTVYAGPTSGGAAAPGFRALVNLDVAPISSLDLSTGVAIHGTNTNNSASSGYVGEYIESKSAVSTNFPTSAQWGDTGSISLTAGDWDVTLMVATTINGASVPAAGWALGISTTTGNSSTGLTIGENETWAVMDTTSSTPSIGGVIPNYRMSIGSTTVVYGKIFCTYTGGPPQFTYRLSARRLR